MWRCVCWTFFCGCCRRALEPSPAVPSTFCSPGDVGRQLHQQGFAVLPSVLDPASLALVCRELDALCDGVPGGPMECACPTREEEMRGGGGGDARCHSRLCTRLANLSIPGHHHSITSCALSLPYSQSTVSAPPVLPCAVLEHLVDRDCVVDIFETADVGVALAGVLSLALVSPCVIKRCQGPRG